MIFEVWLKGRVNLTVDASNEEDAKQMLASALRDWGITADQCDAIEMDEEA